jgi:hypothetical protein
MRGIRCRPRRHIVVVGQRSVPPASDPPVWPPRYSTGRTQHHRFLRVRNVVSTGSGWFTPTARASQGAPASSNADVAGDRPTCACVPFSKGTYWLSVRRVAELPSWCHLVLGKKPHGVVERFACLASRHLSASSATYYLWQI